MDEGAVLADRDQSVRSEVVRETPQSRVTRLFLTGRTIIRKEFLGPEAQRRLRHEAAVLERLRGVAGVQQMLDAPGYPESITLADAGTTTLAESVQPLPQDTLIPMATALAEAVAAMHGRGVMHRDICPANIVLSPDGTPCLVSFGLAGSLAEMRPEFTHHNQIVGTLEYLAPEQTGRTGRPVDQRADLYALGATLYELATGAPPFGSGDPLRLTHDHLARVPTTPREANPAVPEMLSAIIMHLLEKEPDERYQSAEGVVHDLQQLCVPGGSTAAAPRLGVRDFPLRLLPPSRLVARDGEEAALIAAFEAALEGRCRAVLVGGVAGVGKTALIDELRPVVTARDGWFVAGKFDPYRRDLEFDALYQATCALGRLLLAEPDDELAAMRERILDALGANASLSTATSPEFAALLGVPPDAGDPLTAQLRSQRAGLDLLRAVASPERPMVVFADDLQWAGGTPLGFIDLLLSEEPIAGLLLVAAYRDNEVDATHPLAAPLARWRDRPDVTYLQLDNLSVPSLVTLVAEILHVESAAAAGLVQLIEPHTGGNPYDTIELINALRRHDVLTATATGWRWDDAAVRAHVGHSAIAELLGARIDATPPTTQQTVEAMACLGGRAELSLLATVTDVPTDVVDKRLIPALDEELLVIEPGAHQAVRFRHDRVREVILDRLDPQRRRALQLDMARRLAGVPELFAVAAEQYLPVIDAVEDSRERPAVVALLRRAADQASLVGNHWLINTLLSAALPLIEPTDIATLIEVHTGRHAALFSIGRLDAADEEFRTIEQLSRSALDRAEATVVQVRSLTHRNNFTDAIDLGVDSLRQLGIPVPAADALPAELVHQFGHLYQWLDHTDPDDEIVRPEITDQKVLASARLINAILPTAYFEGSLALHGWLCMEALRMWREHGPARSLLGPGSTAAFAAIALGDYAAAYRALRRILALGEARGYEPDASQARLMFSVLACWFEPLENSLSAARRAREGLVAGGDLANAGYSYHHAVAGLMDCAPALDSLVAELDAGLAFVRRTGSEQSGESLDIFRWLAGALRGESSVTTGEDLVQRHADNAVTQLFSHIACALVAAIFGESDSLERHTGQAMPLLPAAPGIYLTAIARLLRGLAVAERARTADGGERGDALSELDEVTRWLAERAADAPDNFLHLVRLLEAEKAWAADDFRSAILAFDAARRDVAQRPRPWHRALITERAARFFLAHGVEHTGYELLAEARREYLAWGATAKVNQLDWAYPNLRPGNDTTGGPVTSGTIDLLGILSASQALSSQTSSDPLHARVGKVLRSMTGATVVQLVLWNDEQQAWLLPAPEGGTVPLDTLEDQQNVPMSVLRYMQRLREPLVVDDALRDDRFARDPYFSDVDSCSLLTLPIVSRGTLQAVLLLENRLMRGAFTSERLDAVKLIAGQLAVSLDNAQLYDQLSTSRARIVAAADQARRRIERDLHDGAQQQLVSLAMDLRVMRAELPPDAGDLEQQLDRAAAQVTDAIDTLRELSRGIHPAVLSKGGLKPALQALIRRSPIPAQLELNLTARLPDQVEVSAYYIIAEALTNAAKHSRASAITVAVAQDDADGSLRIEVADDGVGGADFSSGTGLLGLKDRAEALGGQIELRSPSGLGTTVRVRFATIRARVDASQ